MQDLFSGAPIRYYLDRDPDVLILHRSDGSLVGTLDSRDFAPRALLSSIKSTDRGEELWDASLPTLQAHFFGHFEVRCNGEPVAFSRHGKALAILKYLLAHRGRPVSQDHLMGWLWPESNLKKARWSLNSAIRGLRKLLRDSGSSGNADYVLLEEGYYRLHPAILIATDVIEFDARYEEGRHLEKTNRTEEAAAEYEKAVELYRGDYLVADLFEDWTMVERERLLNAYVDMLWRLADYFAESGQPAKSIEACYGLLEKDGGHEETYRLLMRNYMSLGLRGRALHHYRLCEDVLEKAYDTVPSRETRALHRSIILGEATG